MTNKRLALVLTAPLLATTYAMGSEPGTFDRTLAVSGPVTLDIRSGPGGINITRGTSSSVIVHAVVRSTFGRADLGLSAANILTLTQHPPVEQNGNAIRIGYVTDEAVLKGVSVTYEIQTPRDTKIHASADAGGIRIDGISGPIETINAAGHTEVSEVEGALKVTAQSGGIVVRNAGGHVVVRNQSGGILMNGIRGGVDAETTNGRIELSDVTGDVRSLTRSASIRMSAVRGAVEANNSSGSIEALQLGGPVRAETVSGSIRISQASAAPIRALTGSGAIRVELAQGGGYDLDAQTQKGKISGKATEAFPHTKDQRSLKAQVGGGGALVDLDTRSSKIEID
jgi:DUF4097 and DUF4098 domain-containing protein YvlB